MNRVKKMDHRLHELASIVRGNQDAVSRNLGPSVQLISSIYRVTPHASDLGWVDSDFGSFSACLAA